MADDEALREALIELDRLRKREQVALRESRALVACLSAARAANPEQGLENLLNAVADTIPADLVALVRATDDGAEALVSNVTALIGANAAPQLVKGSKSRRFVSVAALDWWHAAEAWPATGSAVVAPVRIENAPGALVCAAVSEDGFTSADARLLDRLAEVVAQAWSSVEMARRNELLAGVIDGSAASVSIADITIPGTPLIYVNAAFTQLSGYSEDEVLGQNCRFLSAEDPESPVRSALRRAVARAEVGEFELKNRRRSGEIFWNRLSLYPVSDASGRPKHLVATQVDITAEKEAEAARELAATRLRASLSAASEGYLLLDPEGRVVFANARYRDFFETPDAAFEEGARFHRLWSAYLEASGMKTDEAKSACRKRRDDLFAGSRDREETLPDGRVILLNDRPTADGGAVSIATDITSLKATERILAQRAAAIDASKDGIAVADDEGRLLYANESYLAMYGYEHQYELLGRSWRTAFAESHWDRIKSEAIPALQRDGFWRAELPGVSKSGEPVPQEVSVTYTPDVGVVCIARDIRQRVKARNERGRLLQQLQGAQRQEAIGQLAAGVAHDFNNVLSAITGSAALIGSDLARGRPVEAHLERIEQAGVQAQGLIRRLLDFGSRRSTREEAKLDDVIREAYELLCAGIPQRINVSLNLPKEPIVARVDQTDLTQIILNLGINARDAINGPGDITVSLRRMQSKPDRIQVGSIDPERDYAEITVSDSGSGMSAADMETIFRAYYTTKGDDGTGLGLSVVSSIAKNLGGAVSVQSKVSEGTTFFIYFPLETDEAANERLTITPGEGSPDLSGKLILVCDDLADVAQTHAAMLETARAETAIVEDPRDALEAIEEDPEAWDAILTDFDMPHLTGAELAEKIRATRADLAIVVCSALDARRRASALFDAELAKPASPDDLISTVAAAINSRK